MGFSIPKILVRIDLGGYDPALSGEFLMAWVNPTLAVLREHDEIVKDGDDERGYVWYAKVFSQGADEEHHLSTEKLKDVREQDPAFWMWLMRSYWDARVEHVAKKKTS